MRSERVLVGLHGVAVVLALSAATVWPRPGQAALMVPLGTGDLSTVLRWADRERAPLLELDSASGRVIARITDNRGIVSAIGSGIMPVAARAGECRPSAKR